MAETPPTLGQRFRQPQTFVSFLLAIAIVVFLLRRVNLDPADVWREMRSANPVLFGLALASFYAGFLVRVVRWRRMLHRAGVAQQHEVDLPSTGGLLHIMLLSWFANCIVPAKLGDVYRAWLLKQRANAPFTTTMGTVGAERIIDLAVLLVLFFGCSLVVFGRRIPGDARNAVLYGGATVLAGMVLVAFAWTIRHWLLRRLPSRLRAPIARVQQGLFDNLRHPWESAGFSVLLWAGEGLRIFLVSWSLGVVLTPATALLIGLVGSLAAISPITPAGIGVVEAVLISMLVVVGLGEGAAAAVAILERLISYWSLILIGLPLYILHVRRSVATPLTPEATSA